MEFQSPHYEEYQNDFQQIAKDFSLDPDHLKVEFYTPNCQAILVEEVADHKFKIHISLEENRIVSIQRLTNGVNGNGERFKQKYRKYMK